MLKTKNFNKTFLNLQLYNYFLYNITFIYFSNYLIYNMNDVSFNKYIYYYNNLYCFNF